MGDQEEEGTVEQHHGSTKTIQPPIHPRLRANRAEYYGQIINSQFIQIDGLIGEHNLSTRLKEILFHRIQLNLSTVSVGGQQTACGASSFFLSNEIHFRSLLPHPAEYVPIGRVCHRGLLGGNKFPNSELGQVVFLPLSRKILLLCRFPDVAPPHAVPGYSSCPHCIISLSCCVFRYFTSSPSLSGVVAIYILTGLRRVSTDSVSSLWCTSYVWCSDRLFGLCFL